MNMNRILVTGANGQLGSELKVLSEAAKEMEFLFTDADTLDITDAEAFNSYLREYRPGFLINCAAFTAVDKAEVEKEACFRLNGKAPGILAAGCQTSGTRLIHISTDYVFDGNSPTPYREDHPTFPQGVYGASKREGEQACLKNPETVIIRTSWLYSSFGHNFVRTMIRLGQEKDQIHVVYDQVGTPTYARDLAEAILTIIRLTGKDPERWHPGIYHFSDEGVCSWYDFALAIHQLYGIKSTVIPVESSCFITLARRPAFSVLNKSKIKETFNLTIPHWLDSLKKCIEIIKSTDTYGKK
jgi:dTDP-4-dehydrorhamnose reductase